jgi:TonB family protein
MVMKNGWYIVFIALASISLLSGCGSLNANTESAPTSPILTHGTNVLNQQSSTNSPYFNSYDKAMIDAIEAKWYHILEGGIDKTSVKNEPTNGIVVIQFHLNCDGSVSHIKLINSNEDDLFNKACIAAIEQAAPFRKWSSKTIKMVGANFRIITFTFNDYSLGKRKGSGLSLVF